MPPFFSPALETNLTKRSHSANTTVASQATGAMSLAFINALKKNPKKSYAQLQESIHDELATKYTQKPQLSCSHPLSKISSPYCLILLFSARDVH
jgi:hypothetical protein